MNKNSRNTRQKLLHIAILNLLAICLFSQIPKANLHTTEHKYNDFKGEVESCQIRHFNTEGEYHWSLMNNTNQDLHYNESGLLTERYSYDITDFLYSDSIYIASKWTYKYEDELLKEVKELSFKDNELKHYWMYSNQGDSVTIRTFIDNNGDTLSQLKTLQVDKNISKYKRSNDQDYKLSSVQEIDDHSRLKSFNIYDRKGNVRNLYIYYNNSDSLGNEILIEHHIDLKKYRVKKLIVTNNEYGDTVSKIRLDENDELLSESYYDYIYDGQHNWIERTSKWRIDKDEDYLKHLMKRNIKYFE